MLVEIFLAHHQTMPRAWMAGIVCLSPTGTNDLKEWASVNRTDQGSRHKTEKSQLVSKHKNHEALHNLVATAAQIYGNTS